jgi:hypothetical protein
LVEVDIQIDEASETIDDCRVGDCLWSVKTVEGLFEVYAVWGERFRYRGNAISLGTNNFYAQGFHLDFNLNNHLHTVDELRRHEWSQD